MTHPLAPHAQQVALRDKSTGQVFYVWPVDAREYLRVRPEQYEYVTESAPAPVAAPAPGPDQAPPPVDIEEQLEALGYADLQELARKAGIPGFGVKKSALIAALKPHIEAGTLSLATPAKVLGIAPAPQP